MIAPESAAPSYKGISEKAQRDFSPSFGWIRDDGRRRKAAATQDKTGAAVLRPYTRKSRIEAGTIRSVPYL